MKTVPAEITVNVRLMNANVLKPKKKKMTNKDSENHTHPCHKSEIPRLNRAIGQLEGIKKMIEERRYCPDIIIQIKAVRSALKHIESNILKTHLEHCVAETLSDNENAKIKIEEIKNLLDKLQN